ncbi:MAG: hypothetical protein H0T78_04830 [Longispora sp.]|nr:hypothetical protein [Longispora sp. (in: high G+C Gram-positive bacteria)]
MYNDLNYMNHLQHEALARARMPKADAGRRWATRSARIVALAVLRKEAEIESS